MFRREGTVSAIILAGGLATRLGDLTLGKPKAMLASGKHPLLAHIVSFYLRNRFAPVVIVAGHLRQVIDDYFRAPKWRTLPIQVISSTLGTGAAVRDAVETLDTDLAIVCNGDTIVAFEPDELVAFHRNRPSAATALLTRRRGVPNEGAFLVNQDQRVLASLEAPECAPPNPSEIAWRGSSTGVYVMNVELLRAFQSGESLSLERDVLPVLISDHVVRAFDNGESHFLDIGTPGDLESFMRQPDVLRTTYGDLIDDGAV